MAIYSEELVTVHGEMLRQVRNAVSNLAAYNDTVLPYDVQQSIRVLTGAFGYRLGATIADQRRNGCKK